MFMLMHPGALINNLRREWQSSDELRFKYKQQNDFIYEKLQEAYDKSPHFKMEFPNYADFKTAAKKQASELLQKERRAAEVAGNAAERAAGKDSSGKTFGERITEMFAGSDRI